MLGVSRSTHNFSGNAETDTCDLDKVIPCVNPQHLDCNVTTMVFALPDIGEPATIQRGFQTIIAKWDLDRSREQSLATAYPTQSAQAFPPEPRYQGIQHLLGRT